MRQKEQRLFDTFKRHCPLDMWVQRVENVFGVGMPDNVLLVKGGHQCWVELKSPLAPKRPTTALMGKQGLNKDQINWHLKCAALDGVSWVLIRDDNLNLYLASGAHARTLNDLPPAQLTAIAAATNWPSIISVLRGVPACDDDER